MILKETMLFLSVFIDKLFEIVNAIYEPVEECQWKPNEEDEILEELKMIEDEKMDEEK